MWKKEDEQPARPTAEGTTGPTRLQTVKPGSGRATIGPSISIRGDVTGSEDLLIEGRVDGAVNLDLHSVSVGGQGRVNADIQGRVITVEGRVEGDLTAQEQVVLRGSAHVEGDIKAPRVVLEDGANFRGLVDMGSSRERDARAEASEEESRPGTSAGERGGSRSATDTGSSEPSGSNGSKGGAKSRPAKGGASPAGASPAKGSSTSGSTTSSAT